MHAMSFDVVLVALVLSLTVPIPAQGLQLEVTRARQTDFFEAFVQGIPGRAGLLGIDLDPGPTVFPGGAVQLGFSSNIVLIPFLLDGAGEFRFRTLVPLNPARNGLVVHFQAGIEDPSSPGGLALSNPESVTVRLPRFFTLTRGGSLFAQNHTISAFELLRPTPVWTRTGSGVPFNQEAFRHVAKHALLFVVWSSSSAAGISVVDANTGLDVSNLPQGRISVALDEDEFFHSAGTTIQRRALPSLAITAVVTIPGGPSAYVRSVSELPAVPGRAVVVTGDSIHALDLATNQVGAAIVTIPSSGFFTDVTVSGDRVVALAYDGIYRMHVVDMTSMQPVYGSPLAMPQSFGASVPYLHAVSSSAGPVRVAIVSTGSGTLYEIVENPLRITRQMGSLFGGIFGLHRSAGGSEWLMTGNAGLQVVNDATFSVILSFPSPALASTALSVITSDTANVAVYGAPTSPSVAAASLLQTDPTTIPPIPMHPIPAGSPAYIIDDR